MLTSKARDDFFLNKEKFLLSDLLLFVAKTKGQSSNDVLVNWFFESERKSRKTSCEQRMQFFVLKLKVLCTNLDGKHFALHLTETSIRTSFSFIFCRLILVLGLDQHWIVDDLFAFESSCLNVSNLALETNWAYFQAGRPTRNDGLDNIPSPSHSNGS